MVDAAIGGKTGVNLTRRQESRRDVSRPGGRVLRGRRAAHACAARRCAKAWRRSSRRRSSRAASSSKRSRSWRPHPLARWPWASDRRAGGQGQDGDRRRRPARRPGLRETLNLGHTFAHANRARVALRVDARRGGRPRIARRRDCSRCAAGRFSRSRASARADAARAARLAACRRRWIPDAMARRRCAGDKKKRRAGACVSCCRARSATSSTASSVPIAEASARCCAPAPAAREVFVRVVDALPAIRSSRFDLPLTYDAGDANARASATWYALRSEAREVLAFSCRRCARLPAGGEPLKPVLERLDVPRAFDETGLQLARFVAAHYICTLGEALGAVVLADAVPRDARFVRARSRTAGPANVFVRFRRDWCGSIWDELPDGFSLEQLLRHPEARRAADRAALLRHLTRTGARRRATPRTPVRRTAYERVSRARARSRRRAGARQEGAQRWPHSCASGRASRARRRCWPDSAMR